MALRRINVLMTLVTITSIFLCACNSSTRQGNGDNSGSQAITEYTTSFESNGGTKVSPIKGTISFSPVTTRDGYNFIAWCKDSTLYQAVTFPFTPTNNITLYAKWEEKKYGVEKIELDKEKGYVYPGIDLKLTATVSPSNASDKALTWSSSNPNVANVNSNGVVTYSSNGSAIITAKSSNGVSTSCTVEAGQFMSIKQTSGTLTRDDGVSGYFSNVTWSSYGSSNGKVNGYVGFNFTAYGGTGTRGGVYIYVRKRNGNLAGEYWFQFGMITSGQTLNCGKDITLPTEDFYTISIGDGQWWKY